MSRDDHSHTPLRTAHDRKLRDDSGNSGLVMGYDAAGAGAKPVPGDEKFPFIMVPPDLGELGGYIVVNDVATVPIAEASTPTRLNEMLRGPAIDVRGYRLLTFYLSLQVDLTTLPSPANALSIVPQAANSKLSPRSLFVPQSAYTNPPYESVQPVRPPNLLWHTISVVDPVIRGSFPTATDPMTAYCAPVYGVRNVHATQLSIPLNPAGLANVHTMLVFDVAAYEFFRLLVGFNDFALPPDTEYVFPSTSDGSVLGEYFQLTYQAER